MFRFFFFISNVEYIHRKQGNIEKISFSLNPRGGVQFFFTHQCWFSEELFTDERKKLFREPKNFSRRRRGRRRFTPLFISLIFREFPLFVIDFKQIKFE